MMDRRVEEIKKGVAFMKEAMADERVTEKELGFAVKGMIDAIEYLVAEVEKQNKQIANLDDRIEMVVRWERNRF